MDPNTANSIKELTMQVVSMSEARNNLKEIFDSVYYNNDEVIIHRKGRESVVVVSLDDYNTIKNAKSKKLDKKSLLSKTSKAIKEKIDPLKWQKELREEFDR